MHCQWRYQPKATPFLKLAIDIWEELIYIKLNTTHRLQGRGISNRRKIDVQRKPFNHQPASSFTNRRYVIQKDYQTMWVCIVLCDSSFSCAKAAIPMLYNLDFFSFMFSDLRVMTTVLPLKEK